MEVIEAVAKLVEVANQHDANFTATGRDKDGNVTWVVFAATGEDAEAYVNALAAEYDRLGQEEENNGGE